jgi:peptide/nickel transport system substrate-binding protein
MVSALGSGLLGLACLAGAAMAQPTVPRRGGTVTLGMGAEPTNLNPDLSSNYANQQLGCMIYQGLVQVSNTSQIMPLLARSWTISPDGKTYTFELVRANWHDGKPFTSEDVKFSLLEISAKFGPIFASTGKMIESIETPAADRVVVHLREPFGPFLMSLACPQNGAIMPAHIFRGTDPLTNPASLDKPVGTGPYRMVEWQRGDFLRFERNPDYWEEGKPYLDQLYAKVITQASSRLQALRAGEVDYIGGYYVPPRDHGVLRTTPGLQLRVSGFAPGARMAFLNLTRKPLDDVRVRQALMMATNRDFLFKAVWFEAGGVGIMPFTSQIEWAANPEIDYRKMYPFDVARANALLDEAGIKRDRSGRRFSLTFVHSAEAADVSQVAQAVKSMWRAIGVEVSIESVDGTVFSSRVFTDANFDVTLVGYSSFGDPALGIARAFTTSAIGRPFGNAEHYSNPEVDALFEKAANTTAQEDRGAIYRQIQAILARDLPVLTLQEYRDQDAASTRIQDLWTVQGYGAWNNVWVNR